MNLFKENPADSITYADTVIESVRIDGTSVIVEATGYDNGKLKLIFNEAQIIINKNDYPEEVSDSQKIELKNGQHRIMLYDDEKVLFLEIDYRNASFALPIA